MTESIEEALPRPAAPANTQSHGTILLGVVLGFLVLFALLRWSISGVGPFAVQIVDSQSAGQTLTLTLDITNEGDRAGRANCRVPLADADGVVQAPKNVLSRVEIKPGQTYTQVITLDVAEGVAPSGEITC
ncbi:MAG TPA: hypothetical protein VNA14_14055 [Mycobacteriales bacterium]|nr:hypothetical protein [Mycobacteriales bacterium]